MGHADASKKATAQELLQGGPDGKERKGTSPEEMVRVIILNTEQNIFTGNIEYTRALIAAYKAEKNTVATLADAVKGLLARAEAAEEQLRQSEEKRISLVKAVEDLKQLVPDTLTDEPPVPEEVIAAANVEVGLNPLEQGQDSIGL